MWGKWEKLRTLLVLGTTCFFAARWCFFGMKEEVAAFWGSAVVLALFVVGFFIRQLAKKMKRVVMSVPENFEKNVRGLTTELLNLYFQEISKDYPKAKGFLGSGSMLDGERVTKLFAHIASPVEPSEEEAFEVYQRLF